VLIVGRSRTKLARAAAADREAKLSCEGFVSADFRRLFKRMGTDYEAVYGHTGRELSLAPYEADVRSSLQDCYRRAAGGFKRNIRESLDPELNAYYHAPVVAKDIDSRILKFISDRAPAQTQQILKTTRERMGDALVRAHIAAADAGMPGDKHFIGAEMRKWFTATAAGRALNIATFEVNGASEFAKQTEATVLKNFAPKHAAFVVRNKAEDDEDIQPRVVLADANTEKGFLGKAWVADLDEKTRSFHADMDFVQVDVGDYFNVAGEKMLHPGDGQNGATMKNLANCRCCAIYYVGE